MSETKLMTELTPDDIGKYVAINPGRREPARRHLYKLMGINKTGIDVLRYRARKVTYFPNAGRYSGHDSSITLYSQEERDALPNH